MNTRFAPGTLVKVDGLDMKCRPCLIAMRIFRWLSNEERLARPNYDCVLLEENGVKVFSNSKDFVS